MLVSGQAGPLQGPVAVGQAIAAASRDPPGPRRQPAPCTASPAAATYRDRRQNTEGGLDRVDAEADERGAADGRAPAVFARAAAIASQADETVEVVDAALDHSSHRDRVGGRRITVSTGAMDLVQELQKMVDELAGAPGRPSRSDRGKHHAVVTPRVEASPDRSDFAKLGEAIAASPYPPQATMPTMPAPEHNKKVNYYLTRKRERPKLQMPTLSRLACLPSISPDSRLLNQQATAGTTKVTYLRDRSRFQLGDGRCGSAQ